MHSLNLSDLLCIGIFLLLFIIPSLENFFLLFIVQETCTKQKKCGEFQNYLDSIQSD